MPVLVLLLVVVTGLAVALAGGLGNDGPARLVAASVRRLPAGRQDWGQAMVAELTQVQGAPARWRFAAGVLRVALFPPVVRRGRVILAATAALMVTATGTATAAVVMPSLSVFAATLGLLLGGYATVLVARSPRGRPSLLQAGVATVGVLGVGGAIAAVVRIAVTHPAAAGDGTHLFSIVFAFALAGYLVSALTRPRLGQHTGTVLWAALLGAVASAGAWIALTATTTIQADGVVGLLSPIGTAATLLVAVGVAASTGSWAAGARAGCLTMVLSTPIRFATDLTSLLQVHHYVLTNPYDLAAYQRSGLPDVASYLLSDALGGEIIAGLVLVPLILLGLTLLGAAVGTSLHRRAPGDHVGAPSSR